jgi:ribosomal-protein-alanine N-acetyltransferase
MRYGKRSKAMQIEFNDYMIRDWVIEDAVSISKYADNRKIWINMRDVFPFPYKFSDAKAFLETAIKPGPKTLFAIATSKEAIGGIGLDIQKDVHRYTAEMGYWLAEPFWGQGFAASALLAMTDYAFKHFKFNRLFAGVFEGNDASVKVLEKAGYKLEGKLRKAVYKDGNFLDEYIYSILREEHINFR